MTTFTIRFDTVKDARSLARSLRRQGMEARQRRNEVVVEAASRIALESEIKRWALRVGRLPNYVVVDWK